MDDGFCGVTKDVAGFHLCFFILTSDTYMKYYNWIFFSNSIEFKSSTKINSAIYK